MARTYAEIVIDVRRVDAELRALLANPNPNPNRITVVRGRLIRYLKEAHRVALPAHQPRLAALITRESNNHYTQLRTRVAANKSATKHSISREFALKVREFSSLRNISRFSNNSTVVQNANRRMVTQGLSTAFTLTKYPVTVVLRPLSGFAGAAGLAGRIATAPFHVFNYMYETMVRPSSKYNGSRVTRFGNNLGNQIRNLIARAENRYRRL